MRAIINREIVKAPEGAIAWKYADPTEDGRWVYDQDDYDEIASFDPGLLEPVERDDEPIAEIVNRLMGGDGTEWQALDGTPFVELCRRYGAEVEREHDRPNTRYRYVFPDGSAIVAAGCAWDIEGDEPYSWRM